MMALSKHTLLKVRPCPPRFRERAGVASQRCLLCELEVGPGDQYCDFVTSCANVWGWKDRKEAREEAELEKMRISPQPRWVEHG